MRKYKDLTEAEKKQIIKMCETETQVAVAFKFKVGKHTIFKVIANDVNTRIFEHQQIKEKKS